MSFEKSYHNQKKQLLNDKSICEYNRNLYKLFFEKRETKLKRDRRFKQFAVLDEKNFRTLVSYPAKFKNLNVWLGDIELKPTKKFELTFSKFFEKFSSGKILTSKGKPLQDIDFYIAKIFLAKNGLFELAGLKDIAEKSTEGYKSNNIVEADWLDEKDINLIVENAEGIYKILYQLSFDIGENASSILLLKKSDFKEQYNEILKENEYLVTLRKEILKRARMARTEPTRFKKTYELIEAHLKSLEPEDFVFFRNEKKVVESKRSKIKKPMSLTSVEKHFERLTLKLNIKTKLRKRVTLKILRSSMACDCLKKGWSVEEINARLGHEIGSKVLKPYINALALEKRGANSPKSREFKANIEGLNEKIAEQRNVNILLDKKIQEDKNKMVLLEQQVSQVMQQLSKTREQLFREQIQKLGGKDPFILKLKKALTEI